MRQIKLIARSNREPLVGKSGDILDVPDEEMAEVADWLISINCAIPWPPKTDETEDGEPSGDQIIFPDGKPQDDPADPSLKDLGITTKKQGRDALEANGIYSLGDYDAMIESEGKLTDLEGITPGKAKDIEEKIDKFRKAHPQTATEQPAETATERD